jgi:hypothetical protein
VTAEWRILRNEELHDLYFSPSIIRMIKTRRMRWLGYVARMEKVGSRIGCWWENQRGRGRWEDQDVGGCIILGWILERWDGVMWTGLVRLEIGTGGELL